MHYDWGTNWHLWWNARPKNLFSCTLIFVSSIFLILVNIFLVNLLLKKITDEMTLCPDIDVISTLFSLILLPTTWICGRLFYPTFFNIIHYCTQFEESACNPKKQLACCAFFWRSYAYTLVSELLLLLLRFRSWILRNTKTWALLCGKSHAEKKSPFVEEYYRRLWIWWWCDYLY